MSGGRAGRKRERIVETANRLFYRRGYARTSFTDIARAAQVPRGNFYYHFPSKEAILCAVMDARVTELSALLADWDRRLPEPRARIRAFLALLRERSPELARYGCPLGTLAQELGKGQPLRAREARASFDLLRGWLERNFAALEPAAARERAMHVLICAQGAVALGHVYRDPATVQREITRLEAWLDGL